REPDDGRQRAQLAPDPLERLLGGEPRAIEETVRVLEHPALGGGHPGAPEPDDVDPADDRRAPVDEHVGWHVRVHLRHTTYVGVGADSREGHHAREPADRRALADLAVTRDPGVVDDDRAVADLAIVGDVAHGHDEAAGADVGPSVGTRRAVDRHVLANHGLGTDPDPGGGALLEFQVLRPATQDGAVADLHARRELPGEARLRGDDSAVTDREMVGDAHLAGEHDTPADPARPGDPHLGDDDRVLADLDVVTDLHEVVDLGPAADDRLPQGGTVDGRVGADLDVVLDHHGADLRDLPVRFAVEGVAEAVGADHRARVDHDALAEPHPGADGHARVHDRRLADLGARPDERQRTDPDVGPDDGARLDHGERPDRGGRRDARVAGDDC